MCGLISSDSEKCKESDLETLGTWGDFGITFPGELGSDLPRGHTEANVSESLKLFYKH